MVLVSCKPINPIVLDGLIVIVMHFLQAGRKCATLPGTEESMTTTLDCITALFCQVDDHLVGLAAAAVSKPTAACYTRYFIHLYIGVFTNGTGPYGDALRRPVIDVYGNFPEKSASMGENRTCNSLKILDFSSVSFPKKFLLGRVCCSSCSLTV